MRTLAVIGIGAGNPAHITQEAIAALQQSDVVIALDKGEQKADLLQLRRNLLAEFAPKVELVTVMDPPRDRNPVDYDAEVRRWHQARAYLLADAITSNSADDATVAFMVWGDPSLYDSTLRIIEQMHELTELEAKVQVIPGITAVQTLTAVHGIVLNQLGAPIHITTGRRLPMTHTELLRNCVVLLDGGSAWQQIAPGEKYIWWGAYLGTPQQVLRHGKLAEIGVELAKLKEQLRAEHGWIMDTYLIREGE
ncbi:MAG: precorrin-6A synthase (deacetylating) [Corynebacterium sp.]|nr:precorrin-6A synthase (deacetylating) [Corynebacterium sp.]